MVKNQRWESWAGGSVETLVEVEVKGLILPDPIFFGKQNHIVASRISTWRPSIGPLGRQLDATWMPLVHVPCELDAMYLSCGSLRPCHITTSVDCTSFHVSSVQASVTLTAVPRGTPFCSILHVLLKIQNATSFTSRVHLR